MVTDKGQLILARKDSLQIKSTTRGALSIHPRTLSDHTNFIIFTLLRRVAGVHMYLIVLQYYLVDERGNPLP